MLGNVAAAQLNFHPFTRIVLSIGSNVTVGHRVTLHGCQIGDSCLIGMGSTILNNSKLGNHVLIGANTLIPENKVIPDYAVVMGTPGKIVRYLNEEEAQRFAQGAAHYKANALLYKTSLLKL